MSDSSDEEQVEAKRREEINKLFKDFKTETEKRQVSSSENFDKSVLTYSSWALGISIAFLKDFVPITSARFPLALYLSWIAFVLTIALTTFSFLVSYKGLEVSLYHAAKYYLDEDESYFNKGNLYNDIVKWFNRVSAISFLMGLVSTIIFVSANLENASIMKSKQNSSIALEGLQPAMMTKVPQSSSQVTRGMPAPAMQKIPQQSPKPGSTPVQTNVSTQQPKKSP